MEANGGSEPVLDTRHVKLGGRSAVEIVGEVDPARGEAIIAYGGAREVVVRDPMRWALVAAAAGIAAEGSP